MTLRPTLLLIFHLILLGFFSMLAFSHNPGGIYTGNDGPEVVAVAYEQLHFFGISSLIHTNFLQGLGNLSIPMNFSFMPGFWFHLYDQSVPPVIGQAFTYTTFALMTFIAVLIFGASYQFPRGVTYTAAWLLTILLFPYIRGVAIYPITACAPSHVINILAASISDIGIRRMGKGTWRASALYALLALAGITLLLFTMPSHLILILPFLGISALIAFLSADREERKRKLILAALLLAFAGACGWVEYVLGLLMSTSSGFFIKELMPTYPQDRVYISILFHGKTQGMRLGPELFVLGFLGAASLFIAVRQQYLSRNRPRILKMIAILASQIVVLLIGELFVHKWGGSRAPMIGWYHVWLFVASALLAVNIYFSGIRRSAAQDIPLFDCAKVVLLSQASLLLVGEWLMHRADGWSAPALVYFEEPLFALYALLGVYFIAVKLPAAIYGAPPKLKPVFSYAIPLAVIGSIAWGIWCDPIKPRDPHNYRLPPETTPLTSILENEIAAHPGLDFRGRVVSVVPGAPFHPQVYYFSEMNAYSGNDHQTTGLWLKSIPTLHEYSALITPGFYMLIHRFLSVPNDPQQRSWTNFSRVDPKILRLLGVKFILSNAPHIDSARERAVLPVINAAAQGLFTYGRPDALHLYELSDANTAGISVKEVVNASDVQKAADLMAAPSFDLHTGVVAHGTAPSQPLVPASESRISIEQGTYRIRAKSSGWTMLLVPIEYSNCLSISAVSGQLPQAQRMDIALTGLLFNKELDIRMVQETGPFTNPRCRFRDYRDFKAIMPATNS